MDLLHVSAASRRGEPSVCLYTSYNALSIDFFRAARLKPAAEAGSTQAQGLPEESRHPNVVRFGGPDRGIDLPGPASSVL